MGSKYDKIKKAMSEDNEPLPPELNWEQMEDGIFKKMDALQAQAVNPSSSKRGPLKKRDVVIILLLAMIASVLVFMNPQSNRDPNTSPSNKGIGQSGLPGLTSKEPMQQKPSSSPKNPISKASSATNDPTEDSGFRSEQGLTKMQGPTETSSLPPQAAKGISARQNPKQEKQRAQAHKAPVEELSALNPSGIAFNGMVSKNDEKAWPLEASDAVLPAKDSMRNSALQSRGELPFNSAFAPLPAKAFSVQKETEENALPATSPSGAEIEPLPMRSLASPKRFALTGGLSVWSMGYGADKPERHPYERTLPSYHAQLNYTHTFKRNYIVLIGLQFQQLESRFDWSESLDDYKITLTDTILQIQTNALTGQQSVIRGDVELDATATRIIRHYNRTQLVQIPVALGKTWTIKRRWQADVLIGGALTVYSSNTGRTFYQGEIQYYDEGPAEFLENQWKVHGLIMGRMTYHISPYLGVTTGIQLQKSLSNWSTEQNIQMHPNVLNWEIGMMFSLK